MVILVLEFQVCGYKIKFILPKSEHGNCLEQRNFQPTTWSCRHRKIKVSWVVEFLFMQYRLWSLKLGDYKLCRLLSKNKQIQRNFDNF